MKPSRELREYLRELGKLGGKSTSDKQKAARQSNVAKARQVRLNTLSNKPPIQEMEAPDSVTVMSRSK